MGNPRINDDYGGLMPDDGIRCKTCEHAKPDIVKGGRTLVCGYKNAYCDMYTQGKTGGKPSGILFNGDECEFYKRKQ